MSRQILTLQLDGLTAGDYLAHVSDPEPPALGSGLRSIDVRADALGGSVEATLDWAGPAPAARAAAQAAGLPLVAEVLAVEARTVPAEPVPAAPVRAREHRPRRERRPGRIAAFADRFAARLTARPRPAAAGPLVVRWA
ncbi:MAG TPA: hypothetical protein VGW75_08945 [Solirubrobacteraceae bacterium]|jgi:hypothetical protein|nr:hypothetical protein [Solirubrobacteraceae bacterium]